MFERVTGAIERRPAAALIVSIAALAASLSGVAVATIPSSDGVIHACYSKKTGEVVLVDTKSDEFDCEKRWDGFTWVAEPTKLTSPDGKFTVEASNAGVTMSGFGNTVTVSPAKVTVKGSQVAVEASGVLDLKGSAVRINGVPQSGD